MIHEIVRFSSGHIIEWASSIGQTNIKCQKLGKWRIKENKTEKYLVYINPNAKRKGKKGALKYLLIVS